MARLQTTEVNTYTVEDGQTRSVGYSRVAKRLYLVDTDSEDTPAIVVHAAEDLPPHQLASQGDLTFPVPPAGIAVTLETMRFGAQPSVTAVGAALTVRVVDLGQPVG
jgi:hypothetical protein